MFDNLFTRKCMMLIGKNGRALSGDALESAEAVISEARSANKKVWTDRNGVFYAKERQLFASAQPLLDKSGNPIRICGYHVKKKANFCSKCGGTSPGSWWRCGGCGKMIGNESHTCPHCGKVQNPAIRLDISDGNWQKGEEIFAERFEMADIVPLMSKGLNVQESQSAILLEGGAVVDVLEPGFYSNLEQMNPDEVIGNRSLVMVDKSEFVLPVFVEKIRTKDDIEAELHTVVVLRFSPDNAKDFMCNLMGNSLYLRDDALTSSLGYDEIAHCILQDVDASAREFCNQHEVSDLFRNAETYLSLENHIANRLIRNLHAIGMEFVRLKEVEFESEVFDKLRETSGQLEVKRKEIEFMKRAEELTSDATRYKAKSNVELEEYLNQLAHEKGIKDELRVQELERMRKQWEWQKEQEALTHEHDLDDLQQERQLRRNRIDIEHELEILDLRHKKEMERRLAEQATSLEYTNLEAKIQEIKLDVAKKKAKAKIEVEEEWLRVRQKKQAFEQNQKIEMLKALAGADIKAMLAIEENPDKRAHLLKLYEMEMQSKMTPELLLAAAAARGNGAAAEALNRMNKEEREAINRLKEENKEVYEHMLQMNERMFNQAMSNMAKSIPPQNTTTQIIK